MKHQTRTTIVTAATLLTTVLIGIAFVSCSKNEESPLSPYVPGQVVLTKINVEDSVYIPRISWGGGYVSALGVNRGNAARLDTSLVWLIHQAGDNLHYQQRFAQVPTGAEDITTTYGGHPLTAMQEDQVYMFWVAKEEVWPTITANAGKLLVRDSTMTALSRVSGDTLFLNAQSFIPEVRPIDLYIGIKNVRSVGKLGVIEVIQTNTSNTPILRWTLIQTNPALPDTMLANIGIAGGDKYDVSTVAWEILAVDTSTGQRVYWAKDVITSPLVAGQNVPGTDVFTALAPTGLQRKSGYYIWIANKNWDQRNRTRTAANYAYATFETY